MSESKQQDHDNLMEFCDKLNSDFQRDGVPLAVIPLRTLLQMQSIVQQHDAIVQQQEKGREITIQTPAVSPLEHEWGVDIGIAGGSPRPEHVHLCRDTAQDIIRNKRK